MARLRSWRRVHKLYERIRERYFKEFDLPPATELEWEWLPENSPWLGMTHLDEDWDPHLIQLHPIHCKAERHLEDTLTHEMSHMHLGPTVSCTYPSRRWREEMDRLYQLGAFWF